jgi:CDGSH-type Zn-finger protein/uncharacterized Fe-S cluster protein YjdI
MPPYTGKDQDRRYTGQHADVTYSLKRCIHARECVTRLNTVFNPDQRPWIQVGDTPADALAEVVVRCPSGALHIDRKDGGEPEATPAENRIILWADGPLQLTGDVHISGAQVEIQSETRATLCRCGESKNKPFCDNSHRDIAFKAEVRTSPKGDLALEAEGGTLRITPHANGPIQVDGAVRIINEHGTGIFAGTQTFLCRCGGSQNKPFCDGSHHAKNFTAD